MSLGSATTADASVLDVDDMPADIVLVPRPVDLFVSRVISDLPWVGDLPREHESVGLAS